MKRIQTSSAFLAYFSLFWKIKVGLWDHHAVRVTVNAGLLTEPICETWYAYRSTWAYRSSALRKTLPSVCCVLVPPVVARQRLGKHVSAAPNTRNSRRTVGLVCLWVSLYIPLLLRGNNSVKTLPQQRSIFGAVVFYADRVVGKKSSRFFQEFRILLWGWIVYVV
jgi:hypothetical protein